MDEICQISGKIIDFRFSFVIFELFTIKLAQIKLPRKLIKTKKTIYPLLSFQKLLKITDSQIVFIRIPKNMHITVDPKNLCNENYLRVKSSNHCS